MSLKDLTVGILMFLVVGLAGYAKFSGLIGDRRMLETPPKLKKFKPKLQWEPT